MTLAALARLAEIVDEQRRLADEAARILAGTEADRIESGRASSAPAAKPDRWLSTKSAMRIADANSPSTLYRWRDDFGLPAKRDGGRWLFDETGVRAIAEMRTKGRLRRVRGENSRFTAISAGSDGESKPSD